MAMKEPTGVRALAGALALAAALASASAGAVSGKVDLEVVDRSDGQSLTAIERFGQRWIVGAPGHEYLVRIRNRTGGRLLAVTSVDGVNVVTGETASPAQSGYVLEPWSSVEITGWRKSLATAAAFYFTDLGDAYATRTGRPDNLGVIGVAVFDERRRVAEVTEPRLAQRAEKPSAEAMPSPRSADASRNAPMAAGAPLGTGHGRDESSPVQRVRFERASSTPREIVTVRYDRRENLIAMGVLPSVPLAGMPRAFPDWTPGFVPDPPPR